MAEQIFELPLVADSGQDSLDLITVNKSDIVGLFHSKFESDKQCVISITSSAKLLIAQRYETVKAVLYGVRESPDTVFKKGKVYYNDENGTVIESVEGETARRFAVTNTTAFLAARSYYSPPGKLLASGTDYTVGDRISDFNATVYERTESPPYESVIPSIKGVS